MKALIASNGAAYDFTHNLEKLIDGCEACGETLPKLPYDLLNLQPFAVAFRYDTSDPVAEADKVAIRESVQMLRDFVLGRIGALERTA